MGYWLKKQRTCSFSGTLKVGVYLNSRNKIYWAAENPVLNRDMLLHNMFGVWCAMITYLLTYLLHGAESFLRS
jgi:hypothetical protein